MLPGPSIQEDRDRRWLPFTAKHTEYHPVLPVSTDTLLSLTNLPNWFFLLHPCAPPAHCLGQSHRDLLKGQTEPYHPPFTALQWLPIVSETLRPASLRWRCRVKSLHLSLGKAAVPQPLLRNLPHPQLWSPRGAVYYTLHGA